MQQEPTQWELLNAYADDELSAAERSAFETTLEADEELQAQLAQIRVLKRSLGSLRPAEAIATKAPARRHTAFWGGAIAACLLIGVAAYLFLPTGNGWVETALERHRALSQDTFVIDETQGYPVISSGSYDTVRAPNLLASRLYLVDVATVPSDLGDMISMHYRGLNGCSLSIFAVLAPQEARSAFEVPQSASVLFRHLALGRYWVAVVAEGMDTGRFSAIAAAVEVTLLQELDADEYRSAMAETYEQAVPCT